VSKVKTEPWEFHENAIPPINPKAESRLGKVFQGLVKELEVDLGNFDATVRGRALEKLASLEIPGAEQRDDVNLHTHTFFSYHSAAWSPSRYAWEVRKAGLYAAGIIDFDGLDGVEEFLAASEALAVRGTAGIEVRAFLKEFGDVEIDSPGEPGVHYMAGSGFVKVPKVGTKEHDYLLSLQRTSASRSRELVERINKAVPDIAIDFDAVCKARTPSGYATERHFVSAYVDKAQEVFPSPDRLADFWSGVLGQPKAAITALLATMPAFEEKVRGKLMKRGGLGYVQPGPATFPPVGEVYAWIKDCGAIPMDSWLDGTSPGESRARELLECNRDLGARVLNIIPDRNWNIKDPADKQRKLDNLAKVVALATEYHMPVHIGTEGNKAGLPFVDDLSGAELAPYKTLFVSSARILVGHAVLCRFADLPYAGEAADAMFSGDVKAKNEFFEAVGALPPVNAQVSLELRELGAAKALNVLKDSARRAKWSGVRYP
jgi:PHP domain